MVLTFRINRNINVLNLGVCVMVLKQIYVFQNIILF